MKRAILSICLLLLSITTFPCMNEYEDIEGLFKADFISDHRIRPTSIHESALEDYLITYQYRLKELGKAASDMVIAMVYLEKYKEALKYSTQLVAKHPKEYNIVITHAVCLELNGRPAEALVFLKKAVELNPMSHNGSEWIHMNILENQIQQTPLRSVIRIDFGNDSIPQMEDKTKTPFALVEMLEFQLEDRRYFIDTTNATYGSMLFDFANLLFMVKDEEQALVNYQECKRYGFTNPALEKRISYLNRMNDIRDYQKMEEWKIRDKERRANFDREYEKNWPERFFRSMYSQRSPFPYLSILIILATTLGFIYIILKKRHA